MELEWLATSEAPAGRYPFELAAPDDGTEAETPRWSSTPGR